jgi:hypothetical protein
MCEFFRIIGSIVLADMSLLFYQAIHVKITCGYGSTTIEHLDFEYGAKSGKREITKRSFNFC